MLRDTDETQETGSEKEIGIIYIRIDLKLSENGILINIIDVADYLLWQ